MVIQFYDILTKLKPRTRSPTNYNYMMYNSITYALDGSSTTYENVISHF